MRRFVQRAMISPLAIGSGGSSSGSSGSGGSTDKWFNDGDTHIWINLCEGRTSLMLAWTCANDVTVDWGDGTEPEIVKSAGAYSNTYTSMHDYEKSGDYVIRLTGTNILLVSSSKGCTFILNNITPNASINNHYRHAIYKIELGDTCKIDNYALYAMSNIKEVLVHCSGAIGGYAFASFTRMTKITFCKSITSIAQYAFQSCHGLRYIDFTQQDVVPTCTSTTFFNLPTDCEIRVPAALYDEWISATNWSNLASQIVAV